jgi:hypothetical protein
MRIKAMRLPENLCLEDVGDVVARLRVPMDRTNVARALRAVSIDGVWEPANRLGRWRIPRSKLVECVAACLLRRASRSPDRCALRPEKFVTAAAELMLADGELAKLVPRRLKTEILERQRALEERRRRDRAAKKAAERRACEAEERRLHARVVRNAYWRARYVYLAQFITRLPNGATDWAGDQRTFDRDWPRDMPDGWLPPPAVYEAIKDFLQRRDIPGNLNLEEPELRELLPPYEPGKPWPWRKPG